MTRNHDHFAIGGLVSLSFDDGLAEHLDVAIPILNDSGLTGTFYIHAGAATFSQRQEEWRRAARDGHELGNHTIFHPADRRKSWVREGNALDLYTLDRMEQELQLANQLLFAVDGRDSRTFAYPCSNSVLGSRGFVKSLLFKMGLEFTRWPGLVDRLGLDFGSTETSYASLVKKHFFAARSGGLTWHSSIPSVNTVDRHAIPSAAVDGWTAQQLIELTERGLAAETWVNFQFHGVGGGHHLDCTKNDFSQFVEWLANNAAGRVVTIHAGAQRIWESPVSPQTLESPLEASR